MKFLACLLVCTIALATATNTNRTSSFVYLVSPKIVPFLLGTYRFDTLEPVPFPMDMIIPPTAQSVSVTAFVRSGMNNYEAAINLWLWVDCPEKGFQDTKFKRGYRYTQAAYAFDSETLEFQHCPSNPKLYVATDNQANNVLLELYIVGYTNSC